MNSLENFMRDMDGRAFPPLEQMAEHFIAGKMHIGTDTRAFYCSELATATHVHLGLLPKDTLINSLSPGGFSSSNHLPLQENARTGQRNLLYPVASSTSAMRTPMAAGERTTCTPAVSSAWNLASAVPLPPLMMAPACPMRLPAGAVTPAI